MKDAVGQELHVGDKVAYIITDRYSGMKLIGEHAVQTGIIEKISDQTVFLKDTSYNHAWYGKSGEYRKTRKVPHRVIKLSHDLFLGN